TEETLTYDGRYWRVPPGDTPWNIEASNKWGLGIQDGVVKAVSVVPKPLQKPHPPVFQPFASSDRSIRWCATEGATAVLPPLFPDYEYRLCELYAEVSGKSVGEGMGVLRDVVIADSDAEAKDIWRRSGYFCGREWFEPFGFAKGLEDPKTHEAPDLFEHGLALVGSVDTVTRQMERLLKRLPIRWLFAWMYNGLTPHDRLMKMIELFWTKVLPRVTDDAPGPG
ncbi:MAG: LLM class flavin-dependent oxidoreductase, partial [Deltaproteobacteria bacterium]|nr:LLM class flavin-dependent oxidoreductase [Deltaproteobacteria bacterium]